MARHAHEFQCDGAGTWKNGKENCGYYNYPMLNETMNGNYTIVYRRQPVDVLISRLTCPQRGKYVHMSKIKTPKKADLLRSLSIRIPVTKHERSVIRARAKKIGGWSVAAYMRWMGLCAQLPNFSSKG